MVLFCWLLHFNVTDFIYHHLLFVHFPISSNLELLVSSSYWMILCLVFYSSSLSTYTLYIPDLHFQTFKLVLCAAISLISENFSKDERIQRILKKVRVYNLESSPQLLEILYHNEREHELESKPIKSNFNTVCSPNLSLICSSPFNNSN